MFTLKFSELQDLLKEKFGIDHLADIARELGVSPQAVSNWKARNKVPYKYIVMLRKKAESHKTDISRISEKDSSKLNQEVLQYGNLQNNHKDTISLSDIILVIARQLKIIIIIPVIICTWTIFYSIFIVQPVYESSFKIMSSVSSGQGMAAGGLAAQFGISFPTLQSQQSEWVYEDIIKSRTLARSLLKRKFDTEKFGKQKTLLQILTDENEQPKVGNDKFSKAGVDAVINMIGIHKGAGFYNITISAFEPLFARDFANTLIDELDAHQRRYNKTKTSETRQFIEERIIDKEKELKIAEEALKNFRDRNRRIQNSPALLLEQERLAREVAVLTSVFTTLKQQLETTKIEEVKDSDYVVVLDPPEAPINRSKPRRTVMVLLAGFIGLGFGTIIGFTKEYIEKSNQDDWKKVSQAKSLFINNLIDFLPYRFKKK